MRHQRETQHGDQGPHVNQQRGADQRVVIKSDHHLVTCNKLRVVRICGTNSGLLPAFGQATQHAAAASTPLGTTRATSPPGRGDDHAIDVTGHDDRPLFNHGAGVVRLKLFPICSTVLAGTSPTTAT